MMTVATDDLDVEELHDLTFDLCATLNSECDAEAAVASGEREERAKGDAVTVGTIILTLLGGGGAVVSLINVLKSYIERGHHFDVTLKREDGRELTVKADNLNDRQVEQMKLILQEFLKD
jgi:hypothetical protein